MKRIIIINSLILILISGFTANAGTENLRIRIRTLNTTEAQSQLRGSQHWMEINLPVDGLVSYKLIDCNGNTQKSGNLKNGKAIVDLSILPLGRYHVEIITETETTTQELEIL
jgi:hypothetical protein